MATVTVIIFHGKYYFMQYKRKSNQQCLTAESLITATQATINNAEQRLLRHVVLVLIVFSADIMLQKT